MWEGGGGRGEMCGRSTGLQEGRPIVEEGAGRDVQSEHCLYERQTNCVFLYNGHGPWNLNVHLHYERRYLAEGSSSAFSCK